MKYTRKAYEDYLNGLPIDESNLDYMKGRGLKYGTRLRKYDPVA